MKIFIKFFLLLFCFLGMNLYAKNFFKTAVSWSTGYVQFDQMFWLGDSADDYLSGVYLRNVGVFIKANYSKNLSCFVDLNLFSSKYKNNICESYINYAHKKFNFRIGKLTSPIGVEEATPVRHKTFMEYCFMEDGVSNNFFGFALSYSNSFCSLTASVVAPEFIYSPEKRENNKCSYLLRYFFNPLRNDDFVFHIGLNYKKIRVHTNERTPMGSVAFRDVSSFNRSKNLLVTQLASLPQYLVLGLEVASMWKMLCVQTEMFITNAYWRDFDNESYKSWSVQMSCLLTGEQYSYDLAAGSFKKPAPRSIYGALEGAIRYSSNNVLSRGALLRGICESDGVKSTLVCCFNWFVNKDIKVQFHYTREKFVYRIAGDRTVAGIGFRVQFLF